MIKIKRGDTVQVIGGRDRGKKGKVLNILPLGKRVIVEGINLVKKHKRKTQTDQQGGVVSIETPIDISNLKLICKNCSRSTRVGFTIAKDSKQKVRFCKLCKETI